MPSQHLLVCAHLCDGTGRSLSTVSPTGCTFFKKVLNNIECSLNVLRWHENISLQMNGSLTWSEKWPERDVVQLRPNTLACELLFLFFFFLINKLVQVSMFSKHTCYPGFWHCTLYHAIKHSSCFAKSFKSKKAFVPEFQVY